MYNLDILDFVSFRTCNMPDYLTLHVPFSRTETFKNSYFIRVCRSWNELPLNTRESFARNCLLLFTISSVLIFNSGYLIFLIIFNYVYNHTMIH